MNNSLYRQIQTVVDYIEDNLLEKIQLSDLTNIAYMSQSSFYSVCSLVLGMPIKKYIRYRRLSLSAYDLLYSNSNVLQIAIKYGYGSSASYSRSFKRLYGKSPQHYINTGKYYNAFPRVILFEHNIGGATMSSHEKNIETLNFVIKNSPKGYLLDVDIDHFMHINNTYGRAIGDMVLIEIPKILKSVLENNNINSDIIRIHNDEFAMVIRDIEVANLEQLCNDMLTEVSKGLNINEFIVPTTICIGITAISSTENTDLINQAKTAMLAAKKAGKNRFMFSGK